MNAQTVASVEIFHFYAVLLGGLMGICGGMLSVLRFALKKDVQAVWSKYIGWLILIPLVLVFILGGRVATIAGVTIVALFGFREFARATGLSQDRAVTLLACLGIVFVGVTALVSKPGVTAPGWYGLFMTAPVYVIAAILAVPIFRNQPKGQVQTVSLAIVGFVYIGWMFEHLAFLANSPGAQAYLMFLIFAVSLNDVAAFLFGKLLGRHRLCCNVSPNKTWEGAAGAFAVSMALPWILRFSLPHFGATQLILTGLIVGLGGQLGDLTISFIKRDIGIKDMGAAIPGHGGILDRVDSLIYTAPLFMHLIHSFHESW